jgi:hypothetical protein
MVLRPVLRVTTVSQFYGTHEIVKTEWGQWVNRPVYVNDQME